MTEDTPTRFDSLPGMISLLTTLRGGGLQQHIAGLDLRLQTVLADQRLMSIICPADGGPDLPDWLRAHLGTVPKGAAKLPSSISRWFPRRS
jgi:hypothetical protein